MVEGPAGNLVEEDIVLEDPVIMVSWDFNAGNATNPALDWESYRPIREDLLRQYTVNGTDGETLMWFSPHGQMNEFMRDQLDLDRECFNPLTAADPEAACDRAILNGLAFVGVPYANGPLGAEYPDPNDSGDCPMVEGSYFPLSTNPKLAWWRERALVFVAERSAFIRPSFNPTTGDGPGTAGGRPGWDPSISQYRFPGPNEGPRWDGPSYEAFLEETMNFVGFQNVNGNVRRYEGPEGFKNWLADWKTFNAWGNADGDFTGGNEADKFICPYYSWPFSGLGISAYWPATPSAGPVDYMSSYSAASEFISVGEQHLYLVAIREPTYLGSPDLTGRPSPRFPRAVLVRPVPRRLQPGRTRRRAGPRDAPLEVERHQPLLHAGPHRSRGERQRPLDAPVELESPVRLALSDWRPRLRRTPLIQPGLPSGRDSIAPFEPVVADGGVRFMPAGRSPTRATGKTPAHFQASPRDSAIEADESPAVLGDGASRVWIDPDNRSRKPVPDTRPSRNQGWAKIGREEGRGWCLFHGRRRSRSRS